MESAMRLAVEGDLLQKYGNDGAANRKLIVVSLFSHNGGDNGVANRVGQLLGEYHVSDVQENQISQFAGQVEQEAHAG